MRLWNFEQGARAAVLLFRAAEKRGIFDIGLHSGDQRSVRRLFRVAPATHLI